MKRWMLAVLVAMSVCLCPCAACWGGSELQRIRSQRATDAFMRRVQREDWTGIERSGIDAEELKTLKRLRTAEGPLLLWSYKRWDGNGFFDWNGLVVEERRSLRSRRFYITTYETSGRVVVVSHSDRVPTDAEALETLTD